MEKEKQKKEEHHIKQKVKEGSNIKLWVMAVIVVLLIVVSGIQAIELAYLKEDISTGLSGLKVTKSTATGSSGSTGSQLPSSLQNLPTMVGGC